MPDDTIAIVQSLALILFRLLAVFMLAPAFSARTVPARFKIGLSCFVSLLLWSGGWAALSAPLPLLPFAVAAVRESLVGALIGFAASLFTAVAQVAGSVIDLQVGFRAANLVNPLTSMPGSAVDQLYFMVASVLFLALDGHHLLFFALADSYSAVGLGGTPGISGELVSGLTGAVSSVLAVGVRIALPILAVTLLLDVMLAMLARAVPQIQVFFLGLPVKFGLGLAALLLAVPGTVVLMRELLRQVPRQIELLVGAL